MTLLQNSRTDWNLTSEKDGCTDRCLKAGNGSPFGKVLGGSSTTDYLIYERGNSRDYENIYRLTNDPSWKWENMLKYFKKSESIQSTDISVSPYRECHGTKGKIGVTKENRPVCDEYLQGFEEAGEAVVIDNVGAGILGYSSALYHIREGIRNGAADTYLPPLKDNPNLHITRNSLATKIIFDEHKNAVGVEFVKQGKTITVKAKKEIIVTAGAINSAKLLMLSGIGPKEHLKSMNINVISNLPVGKNLQNNIGVFLGFKTNRIANPEPFNAHLFPTPLIVGYSALNKSKSCGIYPDYQTYNFIIDDYKYFLSFCGFTLGLSNSICDRMHSLANNSQMLVSNVINLIPKSRGQVLLNSTDPNDKPTIISGNYCNDNDLDAVLNYIQDFIKIEGSPFFQSIGLEFLDATHKCGQFEFDSREYWRCYALCMVVTTGRNCGTCSMGSVVDNRLNVLGVKGLRVVGASAMPNTVGGAIFGSEVAFAEKAAEMIIESNKE